MSDWPSADASSNQGNYKQSCFGQNIDPTAKDWLGLFWLGRNWLKANKKGKWKHIITLVWAFLLHLTQHRIPNNNDNYNLVIVFSIYDYIACKPKEILMRSSAQYFSNSDEPPWSRLGSVICNRSGVTRRMIGPWDLKTGGIVTPLTA